MTNPYTRGHYWGSRLRQLGFTALLLGGAAVAQAQTLNYSQTGTTNVAGTYTDLGTTGTTITTANTDDANSAAQQIGFTFAYNGTTFTQFVFNTNGVIRLGSAAPSTAALYYDNNSGNTTATDPLASTSTANINLLMPLNIDLVSGSGAGGANYQVLTSGTAPNRVCTIQWRNVADKAGAGSDVANGTQYANISFQIKLYETTNAIDFVYDGAVASSTAAGVRFPNVGLKGSGLAQGQLVVGLKGETAPWSTTTFQNSNYGSSAHNITKSVGPDAGRTYHFLQTPPAANDIAVRTVYSMGKVITAVTPAQVLSVNLANLGTAARTNLPVTLTVSGANTYTETRTIGSFPSGATGNLSFSALPATLNVGINTITVSVPADENNANNAASVAQLVTIDRLSYINPATAPNSSFGVFSNSISVLATKFTVSGTVVPTDAVISFAAVTATSAGATTAYQVLLYDANGGNGLPGKILYSSAIQNRTAAGGNVTVPLPSIQLPSTFYLGVREASNSSIGLATQTENPVRTGTFFYSQDGNIGWTDLAPTYAFRLGVEIGLAPTPTCAPPTALAVTGTTPTTATVTFTGATSSYQLIYGPVGFQPATSGTTVTVTGSPATITGLQSGANYQLYIRSNCPGGGASFLAGPVAFSTSCNAVTNIATFPYSEGFENTAAGLPCGLTVLNANNDAATWAINKTAPYAGVNALRYTSAINNSVAADDWFFTPALTTAANTRYQLAFRYRGEGLVNSPSNYTEKLEVKMGPSATPAGQTTTLYTNAAITNTSYALANATSTPAVAVFTPGAGTQYVGFHVYSDAVQGNLYIDDLSITASVVTATSSAALLQAVTVFPNPSTTGLFDLEIHGAQAKGSLAVQVTNALGQQVYTGAARDNYTNRLNLSSLAPGLYYLQVRNGDETMTRQLAIVK